MSHSVQFTGDYVASKREMNEMRKVSGRQPPKTLELNEELTQTIEIAFPSQKSPTHAIDSGYITEWLVLGPFFPQDLNTDFLADAGGEANIQPRKGDMLPTAKGTPLTWKRYTAKGNIIDLIDAIGPYEYATAYAFCILQSGPSPP